MKIQQAVQIVNGFAFDSALFNEDREGMPVIRIRDVTCGVTDTYYSGAFGAEYVVRSGELLVGMDGEFNIAEWGGQTAVLNQRVCKVVPKEGVDAKYLMYLMSIILKEIEEATPFVTVKHLSSEDLKQVEINLPPLAEQRRIAALLRAADDERRRRRYTQSLSDGLLREVFVRMFGDPATNPMGWDTIRLTELGTLDRGRSKHRPRNAPALYGGRYPFIQTGDVANAERYITTYAQTYSELGIAQSKMWTAGTLCITIAANIAKTAITRFDCCFPDSVVGFSPSHDYDAEYVLQWFGFVQQSIEDTAPESAQKNINLEILRDLEVPIPPPELRTEFASFASRYESVRRQQLESARQTDHLFDTLLHRAFAGEL